MPSLGKNVIESAVTLNEADAMSKEQATFRNGKPRRQRLVPCRSLAGFLKTGYWEIHEGLKLSTRPTARSMSRAARQVVTFTIEVFIKSTVLWFVIHFGFS